jgi:hypothetical protein
VEDISNDALQEYIINLNNARVKKETNPKWGTIFILPISFQTTNRNYSIPFNRNRKKEYLIIFTKRGLQFSVFAQQKVNLIQ